MPSAGWPISTPSSPPTAKPSTSSAGRLRRQPRKAGGRRPALLADLAESLAGDLAAAPGPFPAGLLEDYARFDELHTRHHMQQVPIVL